MTHSRSQYANAVLPQEAKRDWVRPAVERMCAGSAEDGGGRTVDAGINSS